MRNRVIVLGVSIILVLFFALLIPRKKFPISEHGIEGLASGTIIMGWVNFPDGSQLSTDNGLNRSQFKDLIRSLVPFQAIEIEKSRAEKSWTHQIGVSGSGNSPATIDIELSDNDLSFYFWEGDFVYVSKDSGKFRSLLASLKEMAVESKKTNKSLVSGTDSETDPANTESKSSE